MDIEKEREAFEKLPEIARHIHKFVFQDDLNCYRNKIKSSDIHLVTWVNGAWYSWQARVQAVPEWISVKNAMPKAGSWFVAYDDFNGFVDTGKADGYEDPNNVFFSHWMTLPDAPQEST